MLTLPGNFKQNMKQLSIFSMLGAILIGAVALFCEIRLKQAADISLISSAALHHHMEADMMHDALHSDVLTALLISSNTIGGSRGEIEQSLREHSEWFRRALRDNEALPLAPEIQSAIRDTAPALDAYIDSAEKLVALAFSDTAKAKAALPQFEQNFKALEEKNEHISKLIGALQQSDAATLNTSTYFYEALTAITVLIALAIAFYFSGKISRQLLAQIGGEPEYAIEAVRKVAAGDLISRIETDSSDRHSLLYAIKQMQQALTQIIDHTQQRLVSSVSQLETTADTTRERTREQAQEAGQLISATHDMAASIEQVARSAEQAAGASRGAKNEAENGRAVIGSTIESNRELSTHMENAAEVIRRLNEDTEQIGTFLNVIRTIAEQTNLLALNAAIEAARAGEQGRGFAVVADEVRTLAQRTQQSTKEIQDIINRLEGSTKEAVNVIQVGRGLSEQTLEEVAQAGNTLEAIIGAVDIIDSMNVQIAAAVEEQSHVAREISTKLDNVSRLAGAANTAAEKNLHSTHDVSAVVSELKKMLGGQFSH